MELNIERIPMIAALIVMGGAVIVKIVTMQLMKAMQRSIEVVNQSRIRSIRELSKAQSLKSELLSFKKAEFERQKQRATESSVARI